MKYKIVDINVCVRLQNSFPPITTLSLDNLPHAHTTMTYKHEILLSYIQDSFKKKNRLFLIPLKRSDYKQWNFPHQIHKKNECVQPINSAIGFKKSKKSMLRMFWYFNVIEYIICFNSYGSKYNILSICRRKGRFFIRWYIKEWQKKK